MKINYAVIISLLLFAAVTSSENDQPLQVSKYSFKLSDPRVAHIKNNFDKVIKPLTEHPFIPQEVTKLADLKRKNFFENEIKTATILGDPLPTRGGVENPSIYTNIFSGHKTTIVHPQPQIIGKKVNKETAFMFSSEGSQKTGNELLDQQITRDLEVPVSFKANALKDPTLAGYESPEFSNQKKEEQSFIEKSKNTAEKFEQNYEDAVHADIKRFITQFENTKDKTDKIKVLEDGKTRLSKDAKELKDVIAAEMNELLEAKKLAIRLNNLVHKYEKKVQEDQGARSLKLADEITLKDLLKDKLHREVQGLRISKMDYKELEQVNPQDIEVISKGISSKLGSK